eukprot:411451-Rhodomonas_salina.3
MTRMIESPSRSVVRIPSWFGREGFVIEQNDTEYVALGLSGWLDLSFSGILAASVLPRRHAACSQRAAPDSEMRLTRTMAGESGAGGAARSSSISGRAADPRAGGAAASGGQDARGGAGVAGGDGARSDGATVGWVTYYLVRDSVVDAEAGMLTRVGVCGGGAAAGGGGEGGGGGAEQRGRILPREQHAGPTLSGLAEAVGGEAEPGQLCATGESDAGERACARAIGACRAGAAAVQRRARGARGGASCSARSVPVGFGCGL